MLELVQLVSRVGIPKEILIDRGTLFILKLMVDVCNLPWKQQLHMSVYHPQSYELAECFNQTQKRLLSCGWKLDGLGLPAVHHPGSTSTSFSCFELLWEL